MVEYTIPCKGIVAYSKEDWRLENLPTREPNQDEFLVEMIATGVCHTDILGYGNIYPRVLGHEGAGRIIRLGSPSQSSKFSPGDLVILSAAACLQCHYCATGHPAYCVDHAALTSGANEPNFVLAGDKGVVIGGGFFGQSSFASPVPVKVSCAANVTKLVAGEEELRLYAPLGCGIMTGAGSITHVGDCGEDDVVAVVGLGGVGLAGICAAKYRGVKEIIAVDVVESRIELAKELGATKGLNSSTESLGEKDFAEALKDITADGLGCTHILDTTPVVPVLDACLRALRKNGQVLQLGIKPVDAKLEVDLMQLLVNGRRLMGVIEGDRDPAEALPELVQWSKSGILPVHKMLTEFPLDQFEDAKKRMESGSVIKSLLIW